MCVGVCVCHWPACMCLCVCVCVCVLAAPQVLDAMSDSTASSTTANDLDLIYLKGIMEGPLVGHAHTRTHTHT